MRKASFQELLVAVAAGLMLQVGTSAAEPVPPGARVVVRQDQVLFATKDEATRPAVVVAAPGNDTMSLTVVADLGDVVEVRTDGSKDDCVSGYSGLGVYTPRVIVRAFVAKRDLVPRLRDNQVKMFADYTGYALTAGSPMVARQGGFVALGLDALPPPLFGSTAVALGIVPSANVATLPDQGQPLVCREGAAMTQADVLRAQEQADAARMLACQRTFDAVQRAEPPLAIQGNAKQLARWKEMNLDNFARHYGCDENTRRLLECQRKRAALAQSPTSQPNRKKSQAELLREEADAFANMLIGQDSCGEGDMFSTRNTAGFQLEMCDLPSLLKVGGVVVQTLAADGESLGQRPRQHDGVRTADISMRCGTLRVPLEPVVKRRGSGGGLAMLGGIARLPPYQAWGAFTWPDGKAAGKVEGKGRLVLPAASVQLSAGVLCTQLPNLSQPICFAKKNYRQDVSH